MKDIKAARELATRAKVDLRALEELVDNFRVADEIFGFLAQQAIEKSMKAWLALLGRQYPITHDLQKLSRELRKAGERVEMLGDFSFLNPFAVEFRYEEMGSSEPDLDRLKVLKRVRVLVEKVASLLDDGHSAPPGVHESPAVYKVAKRRAQKRKKKGYPGMR